MEIECANRRSNQPLLFWRRYPVVAWLVAVPTLAASAWILTRNVAEFGRRESQIAVDRAAVNDLEQKEAEHARARAEAYRVRDKLAPLGVRFLFSSKDHEFHLDLGPWTGTKEDLVRLQAVNDAVGKVSTHEFGVSLTGPEFDDESLAVVARCQNLQCLILSNSHVTNEGLRQLKGLSNLEILSIERTSIDDDGLAYLKELSGLGVLHTYRSKVTAAGIANLKEAMPDIDIRTRPWDWPDLHPEP